jgi:hypothetical protein
LGRIEITTNKIDSMKPPALSTRMANRSHTLRRLSLFMFKDIANQSVLSISPTVSHILVNAADDDRYSGRDGSAPTFRYLTCLNLLHD